ncbi:hypothetical protein [Plantactinospora sonchi]|uniref:Integral membrane protein n=1 Tax=Plantactinospora sonchi TaxID=1544735 RepID=A0ABU7RY93_9ACTN
MLTVFPWQHRRRYEEEMLAVLLAGARPGQRRPGIGETANLLRTGLRTRLTGTGRGLTGPAWTDAAAASGLLAAFTLLAVAGHTVVTYAVPGPRMGFGGGLEVADWLRLAGWGLVCAAVLAGLRRTAAGLAWVTVLVEVVPLAATYRTEPVSTVDSLWRLVLGLVAAIALTVPAPRRHGLAVLGARRLLSIGLALAAVDGIFLVSRIVEATSRDHPGPFYVSSLAPGRLQQTGGLQLTATSDAVSWLYLAVLAAAGLTLLVAVGTLTPPVRRRLVALLAPVAALLVLVGNTLTGWAYSNGHMGHAIYLAPIQWVTLVGVPVVTFALGVALIHRREQTLRLAALGRAVDREHPAG